MPVVYLRDTPTPDADVPTCVSGALDDWSRCSFDRATGLLDDPVLAQVALGDLPGVRVVDVSALVCPPGDRCPSVLGGVLLYRDASHLTATATELLRPQVEQDLVATGLFGATTG
ncbi:hypothetical protein Slu03_26730 [Sediminihabitans luteus]|uniref:SGNH hydrolase domain-containing protein n=1 Tax=Sediminihabitans luteus TaxID=1138585 RepID=UPI0012FDE25C|nr:SGNH hydrolase domain-containing protein [Sediminihabitans luteus]GIJ00296.1 hypothetical protein Slu03_26730 [Sediminihabitans luteus]